MLPLAMSNSDPTVPWTTLGCQWTSAAASATNTSNQQPSTAQSTEVAKNMWTYLGPIIFFVGLIGNILILAVMSTKRMRGTSTSDYLVIMAVADLLTIVTGMVPDWMEALGLFILQESHPAACKIYKFAAYSFGDMTTWIRVLFTLDRFTAICFPMSKTDCCLPQRAKFYCLGAALAACAKNMHVFWTRGAEYDSVPVFDTVACVTLKSNRTLTRLKANCGYPRPEYRYFEAYVRPWIVFALVNFIPFCVILVCNIFIVRAMIQMKRRQHHLSTMKGSGERHLLQTTAMCLAASFTFLVCITPTMVLLIGKPYWTARGTNVAYDISKSVSNQLLYVNNSANFFLYCITGQKFRETLVMILCCRCREVRRRGGDTSGELHPSTVRRPANASRKLHSTVRDVTNDSDTFRNPYVTSSSISSHVVGGESVPEVVIEKMANDVVEELEQEGGEPRSGDVIVDGRLDENKNRMAAVGRPRTESESSSGVSSFSSKDGQPEVREPEIKEPEVMEPEIKEPEVRKPEVREPEIRDPKIREPEVRKPEVGETEVGETEVRETEVTEPEVREPQVPHDVIPAVTEESANNQSSSAQEGPLVSDVTASHATSRERHSASENQPVTATPGEAEATTESNSKYPPGREPAHRAGSEIFIPPVLIDGNSKKTQSLESRVCKKSPFKGVQKIDKNYFVLCDIQLEHETSPNTESNIELSDPPADDTGCKIILPETRRQTNSNSKGCFNSAFIEDDETENDQPSSPSIYRTKDYIPKNTLNFSNC